MESVLAAAGLQAEYIDAVDGTALTAAQRARYDVDRALRVYGRPLSDNELGCHLSHLEAYQRLLDEGLDLALVLEDDIETDGDLRVLLGSLIADRQPPWHVLRLQSTKTTVIEGSRPATRGLPIQRHGGRVVSRLRSGVLGGCGYLITREGAARMLRYADRPFMPIDQAIDRYWENGITPYVLRPFPIRQCDAIQSAIGDRPGKPDLGWRITLLRRGQRFVDAWAKRWFQLWWMGGWPWDVSRLIQDAERALARAVPQGDDPSGVPDLAADRIV